jgi:hypothetical protein
VRLSKSTRDLFESMKSEFKFAFYCPKTGELFLVKERYIFRKEYWFNYGDKDLFGKNIKQDRAMKTWVYLGMV